MNTELNTLLRRRQIWHAGHGCASGMAEGRSTGYTQLDEALVWQGWPSRGLIEVFADPGQGEISLFLPALQAQTTGKAGLILWVCPPFRPYAPALQQAGLDLARQWVIPKARPADALWATEQALRSGLCAGVLAWFRRLDGTGLRRLQLAAEEGQSTGLLFRPLQSLQQPSPAMLRLQVQRMAGHLQVRIHRQRGGVPKEILLEEIISSV
ncbi:MAG: translesion DNA synthesis-associated protein ImuA [Gammaproteobacteria bacterium]|nr:MAG: translesion DNA synthesis-associated protein ImuA [Gammaproteobacteria bacterium]